MEKVIKSYNKIPPDSSLKRELKPLGKNDIAKYRLLGVYDKDTKVKTLRTEVLPEEETIMDSNGNMYDIAAIKSTSANGEIKFLDVVFEDVMGCELTLRGNSIDDVKKYERVELSNFNASNPHRDSSVTARFERIEMEADAASRMQERKQKRAALDVVDMMTDAEVDAFIRANNMPNLGAPSANRDQLEGLAERNPTKVLNSPTKHIVEYSDEIAAWKKSKVISYDQRAREWSMYDGKKILTLPKTLGLSPENELMKELFKSTELRDKIKEAHEDVTTPPNKKKGGK